MSPVTVQCTQWSVCVLITFNCCVMNIYPSPVWLWGLLLAMKSNEKLESMFELNLFPLESPPWEVLSRYKRQVWWKWHKLHSLQVFNDLFLPKVHSVRSWTERRIHCFHQHWQNTLNVVLNAISVKTMFKVINKHIRVYVLLI